jgi:hypothetical protein
VTVVESAIEAAAPKVIAKIVVILVADGFVVEQTEPDAVEAQNYLLKMQMSRIPLNMLLIEVGTRTLFPVLEHFREVSCCKKRPRSSPVPTELVSKVRLGCP